MSHQLISLNPVLQKLQNEGFDIEVRGQYLWVHRVPYINANSDIASGTLVMVLNTSGDKVLAPNDHTAFWIGEQPRYEDSTFIPSIVNSPKKENLGNDKFSDYFLSCKPDNNGGRYLDYYDKVKTYYHMISDAAFLFDEDKCKKIARVIILEEEESPLVYADTNSGRANIVGINERMKGKKVAIVGLGGTGSYLLDHLAKTCVEQIHLYDDDDFNTHNAYRAPGVPTREELNEQMSKVDYYYRHYSRFHKGIVTHQVKISPQNFSELDGMDIVFICVDSVSARNLIAGYLIEKGKPFIDSGMGLEKANNQLSGQVRVTTGLHSHHLHVKEAFGDSTIDDDIYASNIQLSELNSLAANLMLIKWKRLIGIYNDQAEHDFNSVYSIGTNKILQSQYEDDAIPTDLR